MNVDYRNYLPAVEGLVKQIIRNEKCISYNIEIDANTVKGNGYAGVIYAVAIRGGKSIKEDAKNDIKVIIKAAPTHKKLREIAPLREVFLNEIYFYKKLLPAFYDFQKSNNVLSGFNAVPLCYGVLEEENSEGLALENLKENNYRLWNRKVQFNEDHVKIVSEQYGKFHATSLCLRDRRPDVFKTLEEKLKNYTFVSFLEESVDISARQCDELREHLRDKKAIECLMRFKNNLGAFLKKDFKEVDEYSTVIHGDCWCNNFMFKYADSAFPAKPTQVCILDWQLLRIASPLLDFGYFLYVNGGPEIIERDEFYLKFYYGSIKDQMKNLECDCEVLFPWDKCVELWKKYARFGLFMAILGMKALLSDEDELPDFQEVAESNSNIMEAFSFKCKHEDEYIKRVTYLILHFANKDLLN